MERLKIIEKLRRGEVNSYEDKCWNKGNRRGKGELTTKETRKDGERVFLSAEGQKRYDWVKDELVLKNFGVI